MNSNTLDLQVAVGISVTAEEEEDEEESSTTDETPQNTAGVTTMRNDLNYPDWTFGSFEELEDNIDEWALKQTVFDVYESDFYEVGSATGMHDALSK